MDKILTEFGLDIRGVSVPGQTEAERNAQAEYDEEKRPLEELYHQRINEDIRKLEQDYNAKRNTQAAIAMNLSRISPASCYAYIVSEISATGVLEVNNFLKNAQRFQDQVKENIYDKFIIRSYGTTRGGTATMIDYAEGFAPQNTSAPQLDYHHVTLVEAVWQQRVDILLLFLFNMVFFAASYVSFLRYDVR